MPVIRNKLSATLAGGPRQFAEIRDRILITYGEDGILDDVQRKLSDLGLKTRSLNNAPVAIVDPRTAVDDVIRRLADMEGETKIRQAADEVSGEEGVIDADLSLIEATNRLMLRVSDIPGVRNSMFAFSYADFGPENLRMSPTEMDTVSVDSADSSSDNLGDINESLGLPDAWEKERGDEAIVAIFDTGFSQDLIDSSRIVGTFNSGGTQSVYGSSEGHGTMCAGASAANSSEGVPFNGAAPDAGVILVRITDENGQIRSDIVSEGWDYILSLNPTRPVVINHSYGTPICSSRPRTNFCDNPEQDLVKTANSTSKFTSIYAAGNDAMKCGHRPSGITNSITSTNSLGEVITVGALRSGGRAAQRYTSHGRGDCAPISDPKPNVSCMIPSVTYYGGEDGYKLKDMSIGVGGSGGGTSHASPTVSGMVALIQSRAVKERGRPLQTEELKQILHNTADVPRTTHINAFGLVLSEKGYDARFGHGQVNINDALDRV